MQPRKPRTLEIVKFEAFANAIDFAKGNKTEAAKLLDVSLKTVYNVLNCSRYKSFLRERNENAA